jgi:hypothetical protein
MSHRTVRSILALSVLAIVSTVSAFAQSMAAPLKRATPASSTWEAAQAAGSGKGKLLVVTLDQPDRRQSCHIKAFTPEKLVCARALGGLRVYLSQQIAALILPGDEKLSLRLFLGFNVGLGTAIWGTVALVAVCPACAAATAVAALVCFSAAGATAYSDTQPDRLLYLAPNQRLKGKLSSLKFADGN